MDVDNVRKTGTEYVAATERINHALATLKKELTAMREQDLKLLKQLIHISETIRRLSKTHDNPRFCRPSSRPLSSSMKGLQPFGASSLATSSRRPLLVRQQSEPQFCGLHDRRNSRSSTSSSEDFIGSQEDGIFSSGSELDDSTSSIRALKQKFRPRSYSFIASVNFNSDEITGSDSSYAEILKRNIRLWKWGLSQESDGAFTEEDAQGVLETEAER